MSKSSTQVARPAVTAVSFPIPEGFGTVQARMPQGVSHPYVQFVYAKSKSYAELVRKIPNLQEGLPVLIQPPPKVEEGQPPKMAPAPILLAPFRFFTVVVKGYWAQHDKQGTMLSYRETEGPRGVEPKWDEIIDTAVLVILEDRLVPATVRFKNTTCPAVKPAIPAMVEATYDDAWAEKGQEYAFTLRTKDPWARFFVHAERATKHNKERTNEYPTMVAQIHPTTGPLFAMLQKFYQDPNNCELFNEVGRAYFKRLDEAKAKEVKA